MQEDHLENILAQAIGQEKAQAAVRAIVEEWGGTVERIPSGTGQARDARNSEIRRLYRTAKYSVPALADQFGISQKSVLRILGS
jgi:Mor family transcriptional regulator